MDEQELIARLGLPDGIATQTSFRAKHWRCDSCGTHYEFGRPMAIPAHVMNAVESYLQHRNGEKARTVRALPCRSRQRYGALT